MFYTMGRTSPLFFYGDYMSNLDTKRIIGVDGLFNKIAGTNQVAVTTGTTNTDLHSLVIPRFTFDQIGRSVFVESQGIFSGAAGTKSLRAGVAATTNFQATAIASNNLSWWLRMWLTQQDHHTLRIIGFLLVNAATVNAVQGQPYQAFDTLFPMQFQNDITFLLRGQVAVAGDLVEAHSTQLIRL